MRIFYFPLEAYRERYTEQLATWTVVRLQRRGIPTIVVNGEDPPEEIKTGAVLDAKGRGCWALSQVREFLRGWAEHVTSDDVLLIEDMFHPGFEALPYFFAQASVRPRIFTRNYAQSVDPDDFTFPMRRWMRHYENMVMQVVDGVFVASTCHKEMMQAAGLDQTLIHVVGLPFDIELVSRQGPAVISVLKDRPKRVMYSSRLDREKQPGFFLDVAEQVQVSRPDIEFVVSTGFGKLRGSDSLAVSRLSKMHLDGTGVDCKVGQTKSEYYRTLAECRVQINTARQDFVSFTALEASTFGTPTLAPAFRSFPEALWNEPRQLYAPWCRSEAVQKLISLVDEGLHPGKVHRVAEYHDTTLDRMIDVMESEEW